MSYTAKELLKLASDYDNVATRALVVTAAKKEKKKLDPKAKVRNRGTVCVPAESAKDKKDHFPINNEAQARNALARVNQFSKVPEWYSGSLQGLVSLVARKVHSKYPGITVSKDAKKPGKKKASEYYDDLLIKFAQTSHPLAVALGQIRGAFNGVLGNLQKLKANPGETPPGSIDAAIDQINNALGQLAQAEREAQKNQPSTQLDYYLSELPKYYGYAKSFLKNNPEVWNQALDQALTQTVAGAKDPINFAITTAPVTDTATQSDQSAQPTQPATARKPVSKYPPINSVFQTMLGVSPDGSLGPMTQSALEMFKKTIGLPYGADEVTRRTDSNKNNQQAFEALKQRPEYKTRSKMEYDENSDVYKAPPGGIVRESPF